MGGLSRFGMLQLSESSTDGKKTPRLSLIDNQEVNSGTDAARRFSGWKWACEWTFQNSMTSGTAIATRTQTAIKAVSKPHMPGDPVHFNLLTNTDAL